MENNESKKKYQRITTNMPIYKYKPISYYINQSDDENIGEEEFSYKINDIKLKALKEKRIKKEEKVNKTFEGANNMLSKGEIKLNNSANKKLENTQKIEDLKKKKVIIKKKKIKKTNKNITINIPTLSIKKEEGDKTNNFYDNIHNEEELIKSKSLTDLNKNVEKENKIDEEEKDKGKKNENILTESHTNFLNMPDFFGFEVDEDNYNRDNNDFIFDETKKNKNEIKVKKKSLNKKTKIIKIKKKKNKDKNNNNNNMVSKDNNDEKNNKNNNSKSAKEGVTLKEINNKSDKNENNEDNKVIDIKKIETNEESIDKNIIDIKDNKNLEKDGLNDMEQKLLDNQNKMVIRIQSIWKAYQTKKNVKLIQLKNLNIKKLSNIINNKIKQNFKFFMEQLKGNSKKKTLKIKKKKIIKKSRDKNEKIVTSMDNKKIKELIEKEKKYDLLVIKYEEVLKELEKAKNDIEQRKTFFNQNLNLIDNKNQNISINIFPTDSQNNNNIKLKKNMNEIKPIKQFDKINEIYIASVKKKLKKNNFIINKKINIQILNDKKNEENLVIKKNLALTKLFRSINNINNYYLRKYFDRYKFLVNTLKNIEKYKNCEDNIKKRNIIINKVKNFSIINEDNINENIYNVINAKNDYKNYIFNESKLVITKNISKFKIINDKNNYNIKEFIKREFNDYDLIINKISNFNINRFNQKKKEDFIIIRQINNYNILNNKTLKLFSNLNSEKQTNIIYNSNSQKIKSLLFISDNLGLKIKRTYKKILNKKNNNNLIIHKVINYAIRNNNITYEDQIINYIKKNRNIIDRIKRDFNLNEKNFKDNNLFINKVINMNINKIKKRDSISYITKNNNFMIHDSINKLKKDYIITKVQNKFNIINNKKKNNFIINKIIKNFMIVSEYSDDDTIDVYISVSDTYQFTINSTKKNIIKQKDDNLIINKVINKSFIDKIICKKPKNIFDENKLIINKINNNFTIRKMKKAELIINKSAINNFTLFNNRNKRDYIITKIQNNLKIKKTIMDNNNLVINKIHSHFNILGTRGNNIKYFESNKFVINKIISKLNFKQLKKKENIITRTINDSIKQCESSINILKNENIINKDQYTYHINKSNYEKNLIITKVVSKLHIKNKKKPKKEKKIKRFKSKFLFISDNNQLYIKRNKKKIINMYEDNNDQLKINDIINDKESISQDLIKENDTTNDENNSSVCSKRKKRTRKFRAKKLFISDNNQLKIKGIKNKK